MITLCLVADLLPGESIDLRADVSCIYLAPGQYQRAKIRR